jgi:hypothetical protein
VLAALALVAASWAGPAAAADADGTTTTLPPPQPTGSLPIGALERVEVEGRFVWMHGWAADADQPGGSIPILAAGSGRFAWWWAWDERKDLWMIHGLPRNSGFSVLLELPPGEHEVCVAGIDVDDEVATGAYARLGCRTVAVK